MIAGKKLLFRQLFDRESSTYTYLLGDPQTRQAALIDPVLEQEQAYLQLLHDLELTLVASLDTHTHADHITASGRLRELTQCTTYLGKESGSSCVSQPVADGARISVGSLELVALHTPGHTNDSYTYALTVDEQTALFTGDTLLIRGTGRTDFQQGNAEQQYNSLFDKLLCFPDQTWVFPGHDYKGWSVSTIGEEKQHNPRLQVSNVQDYCTIMHNLRLPNPKLMDLAVPANQACGKR